MVELVSVRDDDDLMDHGPQH